MKNHTVYDRRNRAARRIPVHFDLNVWYMDKSNSTKRHALTDLSNPRPDIPYLWSEIVTDPVPQITVAQFHKRKPLTHIHRLSKTG